MAVLWTATAQLQTLRRALLDTGEHLASCFPDLVVIGLLSMAYSVGAGVSYILDKATALPHEGAAGFCRKAADMCMQFQSAELMYEAVVPDAFQ